MEGRPEFVIEKAEHRRDVVGREGAHGVRHQRQIQAPGVMRLEIAFLQQAAAEILHVADRKVQRGDALPI